MSEFLIDPTCFLPLKISVSLKLKYLKVFFPKTSFSLRNRMWWLSAERLWRLYSGWNGVLRIVFFHQKWQWIGFSWEKTFERCFVYFATLPKQVTTIKCFQKKTKDWFENFSKTAHFLTFLMKKRKFWKHHFSQKVRETYRLPSAF